MEKTIKNPVTVLVLGSVLALACTTNALSALVMGLSVILVLSLTTIIIDKTKKYFEESYLFIVTLIITTSLTTLAYMLSAAFIADGYKPIANYLPALATCALSFGVAKDAYYEKTNVKESLTNGLTFLVAVMVMAAVRELLGAGTLFNVEVLQPAFKIAILQKAPGAFLALGFACACLNKTKEEK